MTKETSKQPIAQQADEQIIKVLANDQRKGFGLLMSKYEAPVYWHIRRLVVSHDDAQDAAQETFVRVFRSLGQFEGRSSLASWIYRIATNEALRILGKRRGGQVSLDDMGSEADQMEADKYVNYDDIEAVRLQKAILSLPAKQQLAFNLRYYDDMGYAEIADVTGSTVANVKANYHIAKEKIIKYMNFTT